MARRDENLDELRQHADLMEMLSQVSRVALEQDDLDLVLRSIVDFICRRLSVAVVSILLLDEAGHRFVTEVRAGELELASPGGGNWTIDIGVCGRCARTGEPQLITDPESDPDYVWGHPAIRSEYNTPIRSRGRVLGVLNVESLQSDAFPISRCRAFDQIAIQIAGAIHLARVRQNLEEANRKLELLSQSDGLTGVANRRRFDEALAEEWRRAFREERWVTILLADLDHFKALNDARGHLHGDDCLRRVAAALRGELHRPADVVARFGGEEFAVLLPGTNEQDGLALAERLRLSIEVLGLPHGGVPGRPNVTISIGAASELPCSPDPAPLLARADAALYAAKDAGRNCVRGGSSA